MNRIRNSRVPKGEPETQRPCMFIYRDQKLCAALSIELAREINYDHNLFITYLIGRERASPLHRLVHFIRVCDEVVPR